MYGKEGVDMTYDLSRYHKAQEGDYEIALSEIKSGKKRSHWMWYIFPQLKGLGHSGMADYYGITDIAEAKMYLADPILGKHLIEISNALLALDESNPRAILGSPDDLKLRSCMTLFSCADPEETVFRKILEKYYDGEPDKATYMILDNYNKAD